MWSIGTDFAIPPLELLGIFEPKIPSFKCCPSQEFHGVVTTAEQLLGIIPAFPKGI
jgi:hypothetical protein